MSAAVNEGTPLLLLAGEAARGARTSQTLDLAALAAAVGAGSELLREARTAAADVARAAERALRERRRSSSASRSTSRRRRRLLPRGRAGLAHRPACAPAAADIAAAADWRSAASGR